MIPGLASLKSLCAADTVLCQPSDGPKYLLYPVVQTFFSMSIHIIGQEHLDTFCVHKLGVLIPPETAPFFKVPFPVLRPGCVTCRLA